MMGKDKRPWRKLVKKLRRKNKRQISAQSQMALDQASEEEYTWLCAEVNDDGVIDHEETIDNEYFLRKDEWVERERQAELASTLKRIESERLAQIEAENQRKIREEWEAKQEQEKKLKAEKERLEKLMKEKQEAEFNGLLSFLSGDIETPPVKYLLPDTILDEDNVCFYFSRTAACRFYDRCTKLHPRPNLSTAILIPNFFSHFKLEQSTRDEYDSDLGLEYEDKELHKEFIDFYEDVVPELRKCGTLVQFKVCCNLEPHLRGNVYVQYRTIMESVEAYRKFNGRFYNGRQLSLQFIKMDSWRSAICGSFLRKACLKGRTCNYLHVFRNPTKEFVKADHDWKESQNHRVSAAEATPSTPRESISIQNTLSQENVFLAATIGKNQTECSSQSEKSDALNKNSKNIKSSNNSNGNLNTPLSSSHEEKRSRSLLRTPKQKKRIKKDKKKLKKAKKHKTKRSKHKKKKCRVKDNP